MPSPSETPETPEQAASATAAGIRLLEKLGIAVTALEEIASRKCLTAQFCGIFGDKCVVCFAKDKVEEIKKVG